jgi:hypothetical protein
MVNAQQCCPLNANTCDAGERFIMNPSTAENINKFSPCSIGNICSALGRNSVKSTCLTQNKGVTTISGQTCGNGIVEGDEECDCGGEEGCGNNSCCNAKTCKFQTNAVCDDSNEDCCKDCQFASSTQVCRASSGPCDPQETCTGTSPYCPDDKTQPNGQDCGNGLKCASGQCTSRDQQCKTVMGSYTTGNDTYACDNSNCMMSCASPEFPRNTCYGLQQNFLDGTSCSGGGTCSNGQCTGASAGKEITSWINDHKPLVIGLAAAIGSLIVLSILGCCWRCIKRGRNRRKYAKNAAALRAPPPAFPIAAGAAPPRQHRSRSRSARNGNVPAPPPMSHAPSSNGWAPQTNHGPQGPTSPPPMYRSSSVRYA